MQRAQEARPRGKSPFVAAFLSLLFPGLGHAYAGAYHRALGFAAPPLLLGALAAGFLIRMDTIGLIGFLLTGWVLPGIFVLNLLFLAYRAVAIIDAYRVTAYLNALAWSGGGRFGRPRMVLNPISIAGLAAVVLVMTGVHVAVARVDLLARDFLNDECVFVSQSTADNDLECDARPSGSGGASASPTDEPIDSASPTPLASAPPVQGSALPNASIPPWNGKDRLNILLIGSDQRPQENTYNTDTLIVVSIDPTTKQVAMFSLPRDSTDIPLPPGPLRNAYTGGVYPNKITSLFTAVRNRADLVAGTNRTRGYNALKQVLGYLYGLDIKYFVEVNFDGFKQVVDALGGVTINVQVPVTDDRYPSDSGRLSRVYIPTGIQHMTGAQALVYARSRHDSNDFDRGFRQQRVLTSIREQADVANLIPRIPELLNALKATVRTDIPQDQLAPLAGLAGSIDTRNIRSYVFAPPRYGTETPPSASVYEYHPDVSRIRAAVATAFTVDPALEQLRTALGNENGTIWVLNGSGKIGHATGVAAYLEYYGLTASAPNATIKTKPTATQIVVYNGAESRLPQTIEYLQALFKVQVQLKTDAAVSADVIITTGTSTPQLTPPPTS